MSTAEIAKAATPKEIHAGQRLDQATFHAIYEAMPAGVRAELIGGTVNMPSPVGRSHGRATSLLTTWLTLYAGRTPGVESLDNTSTALDEQSELQPDAQLRILPEYGGQTHADPGYIVGAPELVVEVARASRFIDLGPKRIDYERAGVKEHVVRALDPDEVVWHRRDDSGRLVAITPDADGLYRSNCFPSLWLDASALLRGDLSAMIAGLDRGLSSVEHQQFVARLALATKRTQP